MNLRLVSILILSLGLMACEEENPMPGCDGSLSISVSSILESSCGDNTGSITIASSGGSGGNSYSLDGGAAQSSTIFSDVSQGTYTVQVTDSEGCTADVEAEVKTGVVLDDIRSIITTNCAISNCHNGDRTNLPNFAMDNILKDNAAAVKTRTVNETMPPAGQDDLTAVEIQLIVCWVDDGALD